MPYWIVWLRRQDVLKIASAIWLAEILTRLLAKSAGLMQLAAFLDGLDLLLAISVVALGVINSLKGFDILYIMTGGGPFNSSDTLAMHMYNESFKKYHMGYGSAISVVLFLIALSIIFIYFRQLKKVDEIYE